MHIEEGTNIVESSLFLKQPQRIMENGVIDNSLYSQTFPGTMSFKLLLLLLLQGLVRGQNTTSLGSKLTGKHLPDLAETSYGL